MWEVTKCHIHKNSNLPCHNSGNLKILIVEPLTHGVTKLHIYIYISSCLKWLETGFGLVIGFTGLLKLETTISYSIVANSHTLQFTIAGTKSSQYVFTRRCLGTAVNNVDSSASAFTTLLAGHFLTTRLQTRPGLSPSELTGQNQRCLTTDGQSASQSWCQEAPSGAQDQIFVTVREMLFCRRGAPSLTRGRVCHLLQAESEVHTIYIYNFTCRHSA
jgi:hypothetical protein